MGAGKIAGVGGRLIAPPDDSGEASECGALASDWIQPNSCHWRTAIIPFPWQGRGKTFRPAFDARLLLSHLYSFWKNLKFIDAAEESNYCNLSRNTVAAFTSGIGLKASASWPSLFWFKVVLHWMISKKRNRHCFQVEKLTARAFWNSNGF